MSKLDDFIANAEEQVFGHTGEARFIWLTFQKLAEAVKEELEG